MKHRQGFSIIENLISIVLISVMLTVVVSAYGSLIASKVRSRYIWGATQFAQEGIETITHAFQHVSTWHFFRPHLMNQPNAPDPCKRIKVILNGGQPYNFSSGQPNPEYYYFKRGLLVREISFCRVYRDNEGNIVDKANGSIDKTTALARVRVFSERPGLFEPIEMYTYITNITGN